jgi:putative nucleotidyltransferase with HDIG domain
VKEMTNGLFIGKETSFIEKTVQDFDQLCLIAKGDGAEIMFQDIEKDMAFCLDPNGSEATMEFFYIVEGEIFSESTTTKATLQKGEYFYTQNLTEPFYFTAITNVKLLYVSTKPVFHYLSDRVKELKKIVQEVQNKDLYTLKHSLGVQDYALKIARRLHWPKEKLEVLFYATLFHDIGKIHTPIEILNKPGRLTNEEYEIIKKHPLDGSKMVEGTYFKNLSEIIAQHHERLDGKGYPHGLKEDEILIEAKIIAVSDCYDAMTSDRPYRKGLAPELAVKELQRCEGTQFDSEIVSIFIDILSEEKII